MSTGPGVTGRLRSRWSGPRRSGAVADSPGESLDTSPAADRTAEASAQSIAADRMRRNSLFLMANTAVTSALGFGYWTIAAHLYPQRDVGSFAALAASIALLSAFAGLGLPNMIIRAFSREPDPRSLLTTSCLLGSLLATVLGLAYLGIRGTGLFGHSVGGVSPVELAGLFTVSVVAATAGTIADAGYVAQRRTEWLVVKNTVGSLAKIAVLPLLAQQGIIGLFLSYALATSLAAVLSVTGQFSILKLPGAARPRLAPLRRYAGFTAGNYVGMVFGILPSTMVPLIVLDRLGPSTEAACAVEFLLLGFLNVVPSAASQSLFAEAAKPGGRPLVQGLRTVKDTYMLTVPAIVVLAAGAGLMMHLFGATYATEGTGPLRLLFLSGIFTAVTYVVDALLNSFGYAGVYLAMNAVNAALVLGGVFVFSRFGLAGVSVGWVSGQALSAIIGAGWILALRRIGPRRVLRWALRRGWAGLPKPPDSDVSVEPLDEGDPAEASVPGEWWRPRISTQPIWAAPVPGDAATTITMMLLRQSLADAGPLPRWGDAAAATLIIPKVVSQDSDRFVARVEPSRDEAEQIRTMIMPALADEPPSRLDASRWPPCGLPVRPNAQGPIAIAPDPPATADSNSGHPRW